MKRPISVIVPCYNEAATIGGLLASLRTQTVPSDSLEIIIADGGSTDGTRSVINRFAGAHPELRIQVVENYAGTIPAALNTAISAATGAVIIRLDGHSKPSRDYVERCLETLERTGAALVGGRWDIRPGADTTVARSIAVAASHILGAGGVRYRVGGEEGPVDGIPFGCFQRAWIEKVGPFNEALLTNEDYEYIVRIREAGGLVWFNPQITATYYARTTLRELFRQYARYGYWKAQMLRLHPKSIRLRQGLPPLFILSLLLLALLGVVLSAAWLALAIECVAYVMLLAMAGVSEAARQRDPGLVLGFPTAVATMHMAWGAAFLWGIVKRAQVSSTATGAR